MFNFGSAAAKAADGSATRDIAATAWVAADPMSASTLLGSAASARSKNWRAWAKLSGVRTFVKPSRSLKIEVQCVGVRGLILRGAPRPR